ncbi:MAG: 16S rRNA (cytosine(967)-C(5))-methyltransferase RsmB [Gammaproteobacteria bacterium]|nr:16S rRNA (cytosine(967)-C(5))-methyltransferase RsmB [Gammaproteobacteria bacterium]NIR81792.1 16S rRNA (cytosine(967)-C(5))-methyltransferase RsmB [Gammaproteobacteria bacterium]NIR88624.1 16S rRNA (cytosine(967)-C(5))-methyltransferase RsmB [Gammaproteobacteria bacterium]NIU02900.1 16S rRNA (cytosine(967)-C(5))-methyltransferase RsmB [Gammaproteobacteria bacterium]NIV50421.1 16S rRNA (cytosine(967)-C(5))-methyltransferase RsmB [Gammaproteobacteria bacterium]
MGGSRSGQAPASARAAAVETLVRVLAHGRSLTDCLGAELGTRTDPDERALARELCFGVIRWYPRLDAIARELLARPVRRRDQDVHLLILMGLYQLLYTRIPPHAAVAETVAVAAARGKPWARVLVNGVLRRFQRERERILSRSERAPEAVYAHPAWLIEAIREAWSEHWQSILHENNRRPPMSLRVNARRSQRDAYLGSLSHAGIDAHPIAHTSHGVILTEPRDVSKLPGFAAGLVSVQDGAAQLAPELLALAPGQRVLDACAAPGGKTTHILEREPHLAEVVCVERDPARMGLIEDNLARLGLAAGLVCADAGEPGRWWNGEPFHRILLDVPCTATGVIRRHPDIKIHRRASDLPKLAAEQARLLAALWPLLAPGGLLLYATCSVLPQENHIQVERFLETGPDAVVAELSTAWGHPCACGRQILPGEDEMDGFYYALLRKG